jgi:hypothetical protein
MRRTPMRTRRRSTGPIPEVRQIVEARSGGRCEFTDCTRVGEHIHHRRPRRMGGSKAVDTNGVANLLHLCCVHHDWVESNRTAATDMGLLLPSTADPSRVPLWTRHANQRVHLTADGSWEVGA